MDFECINDYELIYLIREGNEKAYELLLEKYKPFIIKLSYRVYSMCEEDSIYDGYLILNQAIKKFDESFNKTFLRFFELLLVRYYCKYVKKAISENNALAHYTYNTTFKEKKDYERERRIKQAQKEISEIKDEVARNIIMEYINSDNTITSICKKIGYNPKKIYNLLAKIKNKLKNE